MQEELYNLIQKRKKIQQKQEELQEQLQEQEESNIKTKK